MGEACTKYQGPADWREPGAAHQGSSFPFSSFPASPFSTSLSHRSTGAATPTYLPGWSRRQPWEEGEDWQLGRRGGSLLGAAVSVRLITHSPHLLICPPFPIVVPQAPPKGRGRGWRTGSCPPPQRAICSSGPSSGPAGLHKPGEQQRQLGTMHSGSDPAFSRPASNNNSPHSICYFYDNVAYLLSLTLIVSYWRNWYFEFSYDPFCVQHWSLSDNLITNVLE